MTLHMTGHERVYSYVLGDAPRNPKHPWRAPITRHVDVPPTFPNVFLDVANTRGLWYAMAHGLRSYLNAKHAWRTRAAARHTYASSVSEARTSLRKGKL